MFDSLPNHVKHSDNYPQITIHPIVFGSSSSSMAEPSSPLRAQALNKLQLQVMGRVHNTLLRESVGRDMAQPVVSPATWTPVFTKRHTQ